jgi:hypothetical protein
MLGRVKVLGGVRVGRVVATADVTAFETEPEVYPLVADLEAFLAAVRSLRLDGMNMRKMHALLRHTVVP